ncbi:hypothetical protein ISP15_10545 [Dyella jejuensis]|uniref:Uncharacterized protein n=1 Tax=Dyella jejuensis TaxID=1432009 RepID=A0ABW8JJW3_9GAMM
MQKLVRWLDYARERPEIVLSFAIGCVCGVLLRLPLFPWKLGNDASNVMGTALGALIGAGTAAVIASGIANRADRVARATIANVIREPLSLLTQIEDSTKRNLLNHEIGSQITILRDQASHAQQRLKILSTSDRFASGMAGTAIVDAMLVMESIDTRMASTGTILGFAMANDRNGWYSMPLETRANITANIVKLQSALSMLGHTFGPT